MNSRFGGRRCRGPFWKSRQDNRKEILSPCVRRLGLELLEPRLVLNGTVDWDDLDSHKWIAEPTWGDGIEVDWIEFDGRDSLRARVTSSVIDWALMRTDGFPGEDWREKLGLRADIYQAGGAGGVDVKLEVRGRTFDPWFEWIRHENLQRNTWNTVTWRFNTGLPDYGDVAHLSIVFERFGGTTPTFYVDNLRLVTPSGEEEWDDMDDGSRGWIYWGNWFNWHSREWGHELVTHLGANPTTPAGALYLQWDYENGFDPRLNSAEIATEQLDDMPDWSGYNRIGADVRVSDPDVPISVFLYDADADTGFCTPTRKVGVADTWQSLVWPIPWPPWFDNADIDKINFVVGDIDEHRTGELYLDNVVLRSDPLPPPVPGGLDYGFASFEREDDITDFSSNWGELIGDYVTATTDDTTAAEDSRASLQLDYDLPEDSFTGLWFSLWGHSDYKDTQSIDLTDIFGDLSGEGRDFEQIQFWVRGSGLTGRRHNLKIELKDAADQFDRTAYQYITIDDSDTTWQKIVLDADVTNASFWLYNRDAPDPTDMKFLTFVVESYFNDPLGTFYIDNIQFVDADDTPFDLAQQTDDAFLDLISERTFLYFLDWYEPTTGLFHDRSEFPDLMSIAATGFGLTALTVGEERGWIKPQVAIDMITRTLETLRDGQSATDTVEDTIAHTNGYKGFFYHFLDNPPDDAPPEIAARRGKRKFHNITGEGSELSSVDTALLLMGALTAKEHFSKEQFSGVAGAPEIVALVDDLYERVQWDWMLDGTTSQFYHAWKPELEGDYTSPALGGGYFSDYRWDYSTDEVMLINILAIASPTHPVPHEVFYEWTRSSSEYAGHNLVHSWNGSFFTYFFAHLWIDFEPLGYDNPPPGRTIAVDWWDNSVQATLANRQFAIDHADDTTCDGDDDYVTYGENGWGLTAADGPDGNYHAYGAPPTAVEPPDHDGTIATYGAGSAIMFQPEMAIDALKHYFADTELWNYRLGFGDAYNLDPPNGNGPWYNRACFGIDNGPMLIAIENYRSGFVWETIQRNTQIGRVVKQLFPQVVAQRLFYNNSAFDGNDSATDERDDLALATDKEALMPGQTATFADYTSYSRGINGIMVDIAGLAATPTEDDFEFKLGNDNEPDGWSTIDLTRPPDVRPDDGEYGSDRVTLVWDDNAIPTRSWLQVRVKATSNTGLLQDEVFYFGNAIGDADGDRVAACADMYAVYQQLGQPATVTDPLDIDRDGVVTQADMDAVFPEIARLPVLNLITVPSVVATGDAAATDEDTTKVIDVLANDRDVDGNPLSVAAWDATSGLGASVTVNPDGTLTYDPSGSPTLQALATGEIIEDTFSYMISDVRGGTDTRTVTVTVSGVDEPEGGGGTESFGMEAQAGEPIPLAMSLATGEDTAGSDEATVRDGVLLGPLIADRANRSSPSLGGTGWIPAEVAAFFRDAQRPINVPRPNGRQAHRWPGPRPFDQGVAPLAMGLDAGQDAGRGNKARAHDAVMEEAAQRESLETRLAKWDWIWWDSFEQMSIKKRSSKRSNVAQQAADQLLAALRV